MRLITTCLIIYQAFANGAKISTPKKPQQTQLSHTKKAPINLAKLKQETETTSTESSEDYCYSEVYGLYTDASIENNPSGLVIEYSNGFCSENADAVEKSIVPYYCFYTGYNLLYQINLERDEITTQAGDSEPNTQELYDAKAEIIKRFCEDFEYGSQERTLFLEDFYDIPDQELAESDCEEYLAVDFDYSKSEFDPIDMTDKLENEIICAQEYAMIEALRINDFTDLIDTVRFSYTVSLESGNEAFQVLDYARCTEEDSSSNPTEFCANFYNWSVNFSMWSEVQTDKVCQRIAESLKSREHVTTDTCAFITSRVYQLYSWYLQDISDSIISEQISTLNDEYQNEIDMFRAEAAAGEVQHVDDVNEFIGDLLENETVQQRYKAEELEQLEDQADDVDEFIDDVAEIEDEQEAQELQELEDQAAEVEKLIDEIKVLENEQKIEEQKAKLSGNKEAAEEAYKEYQALEEQAAEVEKLLDDIKALEDENEQTEKQTQINDYLELKKQAEEVDDFIDGVAEQEDIQDENALKEQEAELEREKDLVDLQAKANEAQVFIDEVKVLEDQQEAGEASEQEQQELKELEAQAANVQKFIDDVAELEDSQEQADQMDLLRLEIKAANVERFIDDVKLLEDQQDSQNLTDTAAQAEEVDQFIDDVKSLEDTQPQLIQVTNTNKVLRQTKRQQTLPWGDSQQQLQQQPQQLVQQTTTMPQMAQQMSTGNIAVQLPQTYMQQQPQQVIYQPQQANQAASLVYVQNIPQAQNQPVLSVQQPQQAVYSTVQLPQYRY